MLWFLRSVSCKCDKTIVFSLSFVVKARFVQCADVFSCFVMALTLFEKWNVWVRHIWAYRVPRMPIEMRPIWDFWRCRCHTYGMLHFGYYSFAVVNDFELQADVIVSFFDWNKVDKQVGRWTMKFGWLYTEKQVIWKKLYWIWARWLALVLGTMFHPIFLCGRSEHGRYSKVMVCWFNLFTCNVS